MVLIQSFPIPSAFLNSSPQALSKNNVFDFCNVTCQYQRKFNFYAICSNGYGRIWLLKNREE